jgi:hypothetical protein
MITKNIGGMDTAIRAVLGSLAIVLAAVWTDQSPFVAIATGLVGTVVVTTAIAGVCPLYKSLGLDTRRGRRAQSPTETRREFAGQLR